MGLVNDEEYDPKKSKAEPYDSRMTELNAKTNNELKEILKGQGIEVSGPKESLVSLILKLESTVLPIQGEADATAPKRSKPTAVSIGVHDDTVTVDKSVFSEMIVSLMYGHMQNFVSNALPTLVMRLFHLETYDEAKKIMSDFQLKR